VNVALRAKLVHAGTLQVEVVGVEGPLRDAAERVLRTRPNFAYTFEEVRSARPACSALTTTQSPQQHWLAG
jgi:hypothetical protein